ncbi:MAG: cell surface protein [Verrucomicrobia bacterium]|nr:cell surface protein [Verrucomicrobiota bacterium]
MTAYAGNEQSAEADYLSPSALVASPDGKSLFVACASARKIVILDLESHQVRQSIDLPESPSGLVISQARLYVTCSAPESRICVVDLKQNLIQSQIPAGHTAMAPILSADEQRLYVCNRFNHDVSVIDLGSQAEIQRIRVSREPVAAALAPDGRHLLVANHIYNAVTDGPGVGAVVSVIDVTTLEVIKQIKLARGSGLLRGIAVSPDGKYAAVTHLLARYYLPTTEVDFGRINSNALSIIDLERMEYFRNVFLDQARRGAANPWAVAWTPDGKQIAVALAGTHEICLLDVPLRPQKPVTAGERMTVPGYGPRALALVGNRAYVANYFSDDLAMVDLTANVREAQRISLGSTPEMSTVRRGELLFNDAKICHQEWQSCASCHDTDARTDGLNWDLLNDGMGNPKNAKSLLLAHRTPPAMSLGVRKSAEVAVRAGIRHILFTTQPEDVPAAIDDFLKSLQPIPSPYLVNAGFSEAAQRGRQVFNDPKVGCADCHIPPLFTDLASADVGTRGRYDRPEDPVPFDTPTLVELWRTAPYLHDGSAVTLRDLLVRLNPHDRHGTTSHLSNQQLEDLEAYLLSL